MAKVFGSMDFFVYFCGVNVKCRVIEAAIGVLLLAVGGLLYVLYRPHETLLLHLADELGMGDIIDGWREAAAVLTPPAWVVGSLPAGLWALSYVLIIDSLVGNASGRCSTGNNASERCSTGKRRLALAFIPLLGVASELMQGLRWLPGTFDWLDLVLYSLPMGIIITKIKDYGKLFH